MAAQQSSYQANLARAKTFCLVGLSSWFALKNVLGVVVGLDPGLWFGVGVGLHPGVAGCGAR